MKAEPLKFRDITYIAGAIDHKGRICVDPLSVSIVTSGDLPKILKREFGGTCFRYRDKWWYRVRGKNVRSLLVAILPFLRNHQREAKRALARVASK